MKCFLDQDLVVYSPHHITKRSSEFDKFVNGFGQGSSIGGVIGSIFGPKGTAIGTAIGGVVGGILCIFFCEGTWRCGISLQNRYRPCNLLTAKWCKYCIKTCNRLGFCKTETLRQRNISSLINHFLSKTF